MRFAAIILVAGLVLAGCSKSATPEATPIATTSNAFNGTDLAWIEVNIAMEEQMLPLLTLVPGNGSDPKAKSLAARVETVTRTELAKLHALHDQAGLPSQNPHEGMPMPGMVTPQDLSSAKALKGAAFDKVEAQKMHEYLDQGLSLAHAELQAGGEPQTLALAKSIADSRTGLLA